MSIVGTIAILLTACGGQSETSEKTSEQTTETMAPEPELPSLQAKLDEKKAAFEDKAPAEKIAEYEQAIADLRATGILDSMVQEGEQAPTWALPNPQGDTIRLDSLLKEGPVVLSWYRGGWCPYCNLQLVALNDALSHIDEAGATLVAISPEIPDSAANTVQEANLDFVVVSDVGNEVAEEFGLVYQLPDNIVAAYSKAFDLTAYNADSSYTLPLAATYVIDRDGTITYAFADADYKVRAEPAEIVAEVKKITAPRP